MKTWKKSKFQQMRTIKMKKVITIFRSQLDEVHREEYNMLAPEMTTLAKQMPGFISTKTFSAPDGERVTIVEFDSLENHEAWSKHPRHQEVKNLGIQRFYRRYDITICEVLKERHFQK